MSSAYLTMVQHYGKKELAGVKAASLVLRENLAN